MYYIYGISGPSLLIESTDSMIILLILLYLSLLSQIVTAPGPISIHTCGRKIIYNVQKTAISPQLLNGLDFI